MPAKSPDLAALGQAVRELRLELGLSQEAFGEQAGLHRTYVGDIERGERNITFAILLKLARGLRRPASELLRCFEQVDRRNGHGPDGGSVA